MCVSLCCWQAVCRARCMSASCVPYAKLLTCRRCVPCPSEPSTYGHGSVVVEVHARLRGCLSTFKWIVGCQPMTVAVNAHSLLYRTIGVVSNKYDHTKRFKSLRQGVIGKYPRSIYPTNIVSDRLRTCRRRLQLPSLSPAAPIQRNKFHL